MISLPAQIVVDNPRVAVLPVTNASANPQYEAAAITVRDTMELVLRLLRTYEVIEVPTKSLPNLDFLSITGLLYGGPGFSGSVADILYSTDLIDLTLHNFDFGSTESISVFDGEASLKSIGLNDCNLDAFPTTVRFRALETISASWNGTLTTYPNLTNLQMSGLSGLSGMPALERQNSFSNIDAPNLGYMNINENGFTALPDLSSFPELRALDLNNNSIDDISALAGRTSLTEIYLENNPLSDRSPLATLTGLQHVFLRNCNLTSSDLSYLSGMNRLWTLEIQQNPAVTSLAYMTNVTPHYFHMADLSGNSISSIEADEFKQTRPDVELYY